MLALFVFASVLPASASQVVDGTFLLRSRKSELDAALRQQYLSSSSFRAQVREASRGISLIPGESEVGFQVYNFSSGNYEYRVGKLVAQGRHCHVFIERENAGIYGERALKTYNQIVENFDNRVYKTVDSWFGRPVVPPEFNLPDERVYIFLVDIRDSFAEGYVAGYFDHRDIDSLFGNQKPVFFMDISPGDPGDPDDKGNQFYRTLAHELQHMVNFSIRHGNQTVEQERWLDEGFSMFCEYVFSGEVGQTGERWPPEPHFARFLENPAINLVSNSKESWFREDILFRQYGASFAFVTWLVEKYGGENTSLQQQFLRELVQSRENGAAAINALLISVNTSFNEAFANFIMGLHVEDSGNPLWEFADTNAAFGKDLAAMLPLRFVQHYFASDGGSFVGGHGQVIPNSVLLEEIYGKGQVNVTMSFEEGMTPYLAEIPHNAPGFLRPLHPDHRGQVSLHADFSSQRRYFLLPIAVNPDVSDSTTLNYSFKTDTATMVLYPVAHPVFSDQILIFLKSFSGPIEAPPTLRVFFGNLIDTPEFISADAGNTTYMAHYQLPGDGRGHAVCYYGENSCSFSFSAARNREQDNVQLPLANVYLKIEQGASEGLLMFSQSDAMFLSPVAEVLAGPFDIILPEAASAAVVFNADTYQAPRAGWCRVDDSGSIIDWQPLGPASNARQASVAVAGRYFLLNDRAAPSLSLPRVRQIDANHLLIDVVAADDLSGADFSGIRVMANNRQVKASYSARTSTIDLLVASLDHGENNITVELADRAGNLARASIIGQGLAPIARARAEVFPNPCRQQARIRMNFSGAPLVNHAEVKIYDTAGHHLVTLPLDQETAAIYGTSWDLCSKSGKPVSNGVYLYRINASADTQKFRASGKIAVLR
ncbi:MAG: hypothetical protein CVV42_15210 [Candidatus Riflebacteria bacterium HGW-Riflebacteria-2]|jgi:hypothetical protein|nr:MAG: hypothetical protein CVV42_15210 [Candidatus Riflebacteria bacterium HGW-Riflebacteria-2]